MIQKHRRTRTRFGKIHMGVGAVNRNRISKIKQGGADIGMKIQADDNWKTIPHLSAQAAQYFSLRVIKILCDHRAM